MKGQAYASYKYCIKCRHCIEDYMKSGECFVKLMKCAIVYNPFDDDENGYVFKGMERKQTFAVPIECPYYAEQYINSLYEEDTDKQQGQIASCLDVEH